MSTPSRDAPCPPEATLHLDHVTLARGDRTVLRDITLTLNAPGFVGLLGPNGAGKTTLLMAVLGRLAPAAGRVRVLGRVAAPGMPGIGYMPQVRSLDAAASLCGRDVIAAAWNGSRWGLPIAGRAGRAAIDAALDLVDAGALAERPIGTLSGGERQRLLLAQALLGQPRVLLLDEPLMSLDPRRAQAVIDLVRRLQRELGLLVLFAGHELNPLLPALDRVLYLGGGQAALGPVDEVVTGPVLSRLYGAEIEVVRTAGRVFVMAGGADLERHTH